jgi:hypothetical protein
MRPTAELGNRKGRWVIVFELHGFGQLLINRHYTHNPVLSVIA